MPKPISEFPTVTFLTPFIILIIGNMMWEDKDFIRFYKSRILAHKTYIARLEKRLERPRFEIEAIKNTIERCKSDIKFYEKQIKKIMEETNKKEEIK